jgi:UDP-4-amino-4,6-dideoxy-N-acetyl-beta-L-altrosamine transaminase
MIPYGRQDITAEDIEAVVSVLSSDFLTQGPKVPEFEKALTDYTGTKYALAMNSATSGLHVACLALGVGPGDLVWTSPISFVASSNCALYCGANVDFVDIDPRTYNMSPVRLEEKLKKARALGKLPKVVIPVHLAGQSCDMKAINCLSKEYGFSIIEDASHAIGGKYLGLPVGNCNYSDITVFSFHPVKIITTAEGGAVLTNNPELNKRMSFLRSHGTTRDQAAMKHSSHGPWYYEQVDLGYNYRMTDMQAALGASQMKRLDQFIELRHAVANTYFKELKDLPIELPYSLPEAYSAYHLFIIRLRLEVNKSHREVFESLRVEGIGVNLHYIPIYRQPYYEELGFRQGHCPEAEAYYSTAISIPMYSALTKSQLRSVKEALLKVLR